PPRVVAQVVLQDVPGTQSRTQRDALAVAASNAGRTHTEPDCVGPNYAEMMARYLGPIITQAFADSDVTEIYVNPQDCHIRFDTHSRGKIDSGNVVAPERLEMFLNAVASAQGTMLGPTAPTIQAELPTDVFGGARLQGFVPPATQGVALVIRKRPTRVYPLDSYVDCGMLSSSWRDALGQAVANRQTIVIAGGTGTGKSTLLGALLHEISSRCPDDRLVVLEDTVELRCPAGDHLALRTTPELSLAALVKATLRASPTRIVIGEVRDHAALDFLDAAVTGHPGGLCTVHASSAMGALHRLDRLAQRANVPAQARLVAEAIDLVVVLAGDHRTRRVTDLVRITGLSNDGQFTLQHCTESGTWNTL
ncbi:MAG: ATPase, T2SS/T4P/T4SS family, partial [Gemmatimonadaceae bacterium]